MSKGGVLERLMDAVFDSKNFSARYGDKLRLTYKDKWQWYMLVDGIWKEITKEEFIDQLPEFTDDVTRYIKKD